VVGCIIAALHKARPGAIYNAVDNEPVSEVSLYQWLAGQLGKPLPPSAPEEAARKRGATNKRVSNSKLKAELAYRFKYPSFREGYAAELPRLGVG
jgi:nucleoside-diphosphate-sugar epimerase